MIDYIQKGGLLMWPILVCSIISIAVFAERLLYFHRATIHVGEFLQGLSADGVMQNRIVYSYDKLTGRQTGYAVYDNSGKIVGRSDAAAPPSTNAPAPRATPKR